MKTLDEVMDGIAVNSFEGAEEYSVRHREIILDIQSNQKIREMCLAVYDRLTDMLVGVSNLPLQEEKVAETRRMVLTAILSSVANGILIGIDMERHEL